MEYLSTSDMEVLKVVAICMCPIFLGIISWFLVGHFSDYRKMKDAVLTIDKRTSILARDMEYIVHDQKMQWQRLDDLRDKFFS